MANYIFKNGAIEADYHLPDEIEITLVAHRLRMEKTGPHAQLGFRLNGIAMAYDSFNIDRGRDGRRPFTKDVLDRLKEEGQLIAYKVLKEDQPLSYLVDDFCVGLWEFFQTRYEPRLVEPSQYKPDYLLKPYVLEGAGTIIFAPPGSGKSYITQLMAISIDSGSSAIWPCQQMPTLFINLERSEISVRARLPHLNQVLQLDPDRKFYLLQARGKRLVDVADMARRTVEQEGISVVVLDSISRAGLGKSLSDDETGNSTVDILNSICQTWVAIGHTPRDDSGHLFGSQMFDAGADIMVKVQHERRPFELGLRLEVTKSNDTTLPAPEYLALMFSADGGGLMTVKHTGTKYFPGLAEERLDAADVVYHQLVSGGRQSAGKLAEETGYSRNRVVEICMTDKRIRRSGTLGRTVMYEARSTWEEPQPTAEQGAL